MRMFKPPALIHKYYANRVWRLSSDQIFLTFDDGPTESTSFILDLLERFDVKATFFCIGANVERNRLIYNRLIEEGHQIGHHSMNHEHSSKTTKVSYLNSVESSRKLTQSNLFRPPYGRLKPSLEKEIRKENKIIMWSWLSYDFDPRVDDETILKKLDQVRKGDILVFHDNEKCAERIRRILPKVIEELKRKGFEFGIIDV